MLLKKVVLTNVCQHESLSVEFSRGVNGIFGPSAAGKSNLINSIQGAWTGNFNIVSSKKDDNVRNDAAITDKSGVYTVWEHDRLPFSIYRDMRSSSSELRIRDKRITKAADISAELEAIIGVKKEIVSEYVFVSQWNIFNFLTADTTHRRKSFMNLCNLENLFELSTHLGQQQRADMHLVAGVVDDIDAIRARMSQRTARITELTSSVRHHSKFIISNEKRKEYEHIIADNETYEELSQSVASRKLEKDAASKKLSQHQMLISQAEAKRVKTEKELAKLESRLENIEAYLAAAGSYSDYSRYVSERNSLSPPSKPVYAVDVKRLERSKAKMAVLVSDYERLEKKVEKYKSGDMQVCQECGITPVSEDSPVYQSWISDMACNKVAQHELRNAIAAETKLLKDWEVYATALNAYKRAEAELDSRISACQTKSAPSGNYTEQDCVMVKAEISARNSELRTLADEIQKSTIKTVELKTLIASIDREVEKESNRIENLIISTPDYLKKLQVALQKSVAAGVKVAENKAVIKSLTDANEEDSIYVKRIARAKQLSEKAGAWVESLDRWRDIVHPTKLPELVLRKAMINLLEKTNEYLERFNCEYRVVTDSGMEFLVKKPSGFVLPGVRLSGGEKVALGIAFRLAAINNLGLVVLDEPTAGLDEDRLDAVIDVLGELANVARDNDQQIILVTHDPRLDRVLDKKIVLKASA